MQRPATPTSTNWATASSRCPGSRPSVPGLGQPVRVREPTGIDVGPETGGLLPTPEWRQETFTKKSDPCCWEIDRLWKPGDSIQLAIGQKDVAVTPLQMARFYALLANGGKLVTPHVVEDVEQPGQNGAADAGAAPVRRRRRARSASTRARCRPSRTGSTRRRTPRSAPRQASSANFPVPISGKTGTAEKVVPLPGYPPVTRKTRRGGAATAVGRATAPIVVCAMIENGGHGGVAAAPAALRVFEQYFGKQANQITEPHQRLMVTRGSRHARKRASHPGPSDTIGYRRLRPLGWTGSMIAAVAGLVVYGLWALDGVTLHDPGGSAT